MYEKGFIKSIDLVQIVNVYHWPFSHWFWVKPKEIKSSEIYSAIQNEATFISCFALWHFFLKRKSGSFCITGIHEQLDSTLHFQKQHGDKKQDRLEIFERMVWHTYLQLYLREKNPQEKWSSPGLSMMSKDE